MLKQLKPIKTVKIGSLLYDVIRVPGLKDDDSGDVLFGDIQYNKQLIRLNEEMTFSHEKVVLLHEMLHGILYTAGIDEMVKNKDIEIIIEAIAHGIINLFSENPDLYEFMLKDIREQTPGSIFAQSCNTKEMKNLRSRSDDGPGKKKTHKNKEESSFDEVVFEFEE